MARPLPLLALACVLTGCVASATPFAPSASGPDAGPGYRLACPPGAGTSEVEGVCVARLTMPTESLQEPYLAADPARPGVYALGVNAGQTTRAVREDGSGLDEILMDVYVTEDGGATWRHAPIPRTRPVPTPLGTPVPVDAGSSGDPALAFDAEGTLHATGLSLSSLPVGQRSHIYAARSHDLGRTWSEPVPVSGKWDANDRNWIATAPGGKVYVSWQRPSSSHVAWSLDGGATWRAQPHDAERKGCVNVSPALPVPGGALLACVDGGFFTPLTGLRVLRFDEATGRFASLALFTGEALRPRLLAPADGPLVLVWQDPAADAARYATSADGGATWTPSRDLRGLVAADDAWRDVSPFWSEADARGNVHVLLRGREGPAGAEERRLLHLVLDPRTDRVLFHAELPAHRPAGEPPATLAGSAGDHYHGIAFHGDEGLLAWTRDRAVLLTRVAFDAA